MTEDQAKKIFDYFNANTKHESDKNRGFLKYFYFEKASRLFIEFSYFGGCQDVKDPDQLYCDIISFHKNEIKEIEAKINEQESNLF